MNKYHKIFNRSTRRTGVPSPRTAPRVLRTASTADCGPAAQHCSSRMVITPNGYSFEFLFDFLFDFAFSFRGLRSSYELVHRNYSSDACKHLSESNNIKLTSGRILVLVSR